MSMSTKLLTGVATTWGIWDTNTNAWTNVKRMNIVGRMSGLQSFDDQAPLTTANLGTLSSAADSAF